MSLKIAKVIYGLSLLPHEGTMANNIDFSKKLTQIAALIILLSIFFAALGVAIRYYFFLNNPNLPGLVFTILGGFMFYAAGVFGISIGSSAAAASINQGAVIANSNNSDVTKENTAATQANTAAINETKS